MTIKHTILKAWLKIMTSPCKNDVKLLRYSRSGLKQASDEVARANVEKPENKAIVIFNKKSYVTFKMIIFNDKLENTETYALNYTETHAARPLKTRNYYNNSMLKTQHTKQPKKRSSPNQMQKKQELSAWFAMFHTVTKC